jgi:hypothetical protein
MVITRIGQVKELPEGAIRATIHFRDGSVSSRRIRRDEDGTKFAVYAKRSRTRGYWYDQLGPEITAIEPIVSTPKDEAVKWEKSWRRALKMLEESGLWPEMKAEIEVALDIGYDKMQEAYQVYWENSNTRENTVPAMKAIDPRLVATNDKGVEYADTSIIWYMANPAKIKAMWFGKYQNIHCKQQVAEAMQNQTELHLSETAGYDVSFEYNPMKRKAWYSEEFRGCGNGHYYLALNATHALFSEDD